MTETDHHAALREWARGLYPLEAATELLIRADAGRLAAPGQPWVHHDGTSAWIDFDAIADEIGTLSGGERRLLCLAASLARDVPVQLGDALSSLDRDHAALAVAAVSHATGSHEHREYVGHREDASTPLTVHPDSPRLDLGALYPWPE